MASKMLSSLKNTEAFDFEGAKLDFAIEIVNAMKREGLSNSDLAALMGVSRPMISKLLRGDANVTIETMVKASRSLQSKLFIKFVREGVSARFFEITKNSVPQRCVAAVVKAPVGGETTWLNSDFSANDNCYLNDEAESLAA